jgi:hypothetical protein
MGAWTKLQAVNRILRAGGENPVNTLASTSGDALMAEAILDEVNLEVQMVGTVTNSEEVDLTPDANGQIAVDDSILHVQPLDTDKLIVQRGRDPTLLYIVTDNTDNFTDVGITTLRARLVYGFEFEDLPFGLQLAIADEAARRYQMLVVGDTTMDGMLREIWTQSRAKARAQEIRSRAANIFGAWGSSLPYKAAKRTMRPGDGRFWRTR